MRGRRMVPAAALAALVAAVCVAGSGAPERLLVGDPMPALGDDGTWLQGEPVPAWEQGTVYVLDFWATWCGTCVASFPHTAELKERYEKRGVRFLALAIWATPESVPPRKFLAQRRGEMPFAVVEDVDGALAERFMTPTAQNGIPLMMIVDREGRFAWYGLPSQLDEPLARIADGTWDLDQVKADLNPHIQGGAGLAAYEHQVMQAVLDRDYRRAVEASDRLIAAFPDETAAYRVTRVAYMLYDDGLREQGYRLARALAEEPPPDAPGANFQQLAETLMARPPGEPGRDLDLALRIAQVADRRLDGAQELHVCRLLSRIWNEKGDALRAVAELERAIQACEAAYEEMDGQEGARQSIDAFIAALQAEIAALRRTAPRPSSAGP